MRHTLSWRRRWTILLALAALGAAALATGGATTAPAAASAGPTRVLIVVLDAMRPEYANRFDMTNFQALQGAGTSFKNASLNYMGSETVVSHNVIVSGKKPKNMGWVDEVFRDSNNELGGTNPLWVTGSFTQQQFGTLIDNRGYPKLSDYLNAQSGGKFITVGEKTYAVESATAGSNNPNDIAVSMSGRSSSNAACVAAVGGAYRYPVGQNVPTYLYDAVNNPCGRFTINSDKANDYGTKAAFPSWIYPEDGNRFFAGNDPNHLGGDVWVADAAMAMMENEPNWNGMFVTLGGIDKAAHMWGSDKDVQPPSSDIGYQTHVQAAAKTADEQLGLMLAKLSDLGQLDDTLVVLTADHASTDAAQFYGQQGLSAGDNNWYYGSFANGTYLNPSPAIQPLIDTGNVAASYQSTSIQTWLTDTSLAKKQQAAAVMKTLPGVIAAYYRDGGRYVLTGTNPMTKSERSWWKARAQGIVDNMAASNGPDVIGLLQNDSSYGAYGDHGGAQQDVQRVPMVFWSPGNVAPQVSGAGIRTYDILPTILRSMGIRPTAPLDGRAYSLN